MNEISADCQSVPWSREGYRTKLSSIALGKTALYSVGIRQVSRSCAPLALHASNIGGVDHGHRMSIVALWMKAASIVDNAVVREGDVAHICKINKAVWSGPVKCRHKAIAA